MNPHVHFTQLNDYQPLTIFCTRFFESPHGILLECLRINPRPRISSIDTSVGISNCKNFFPHKHKTIIPSYKTKAQCHLIPEYTQSPLKFPQFFRMCLNMTDSFKSRSKKTTQHSRFMFLKSLLIYRCFF